MRRLFIILLLLVAFPCYAEDLYLNSACISGCDGTTVETGWAAPADVQWGAGAGKVSAGDTLYIYGTHATTLTVGASGTSGSPITIKFTTDAKFSKTTWGEYNASPCAAAICAVRDYVIIDGDNKGIIEATDNGYGLGSQANAAGLYISGDHNEVKNIEINDIYLFQDGDTVGATSFSLVSAGSDLKLHGITASGAWKCLNVAYGTGDSNVKIYDNTTSKCGIGITVGSGGASNTLSGLEIYNNDITLGDNFDDTGVHQDAIHVFAKHDETEVTEPKIYSNYLHGYCPNCTTYIYLEGLYGKIDTPLIYNNIIDVSSSDTVSTLGMIASNKNNYEPHIYNNTLYGRNTVGGIVLGYAHDAYIKNNIIHDVKTGVISDGNAGSKTVTGCANNGSGLVRVTFAAGHGISSSYSGSYIRISDVTGTTEANGTWIVTYVDETNIDLVGSTFANEYSSGGKLYFVSIAESDYNIIYSAGSPLFSYQGTNYTSFATWQAAGRDTNSITTDPALFNAYDFHLTTSSPTLAKTGAADLSAYFTTDYDGDTRSAWGAGAYKYKPAIYVEMADPHVRTTQYLYVTVTGANVGDKLKVTLDSSSIYDAAVSDGTTTVTATYTSLTAGSHTLRFVLTNSSDTEYSSTVYSYTWTTTHNGAPTVGINKDNAIVIGGSTFFPILDYMVDYSKISGNLWDVTNASHTPGYIASDRSTLIGWKAWLDIYQTNSRRVIGPNSWDGKDATKQGLSDMGKMVTNASNCSTPASASDCSYVNYTKDHSGLLAWFWDDESNLAATDITYPTLEPPLTGLKEWKEAVRTKDTNHPVMANIAGIEDNYVSTIYPGLQALTKTYSYGYGSEERIVIADIWGLDYYPYEYRGYTTAPSLEEWAESIDNAISFNKGLLPIIGTIELGDVADKKGSVAYAWSAGTTYYLNTRRLEGGKSYRQTNAGTCTAGTEEPSWPSTIGDSVADNTCSWVCEGTASNKAMNIATWDSGNFTLGERVCAAAGCGTAGGYLGVLNPSYASETAASYIRKPAVLNNYNVNQLVFSSIDGTFTTGMSVVGQSSGATATTHGTALWGKEVGLGQSDHNWDWTPAPTAAQVDNLVWIGIVHGLSGINYFDYFYSTLIEAATWTALANTKTSIEALKDAILSPVSSKITPSGYNKWVSATISGARVDYTVREYDSKVYIIAARVKQKTGESTNWPDPTNTDDKTATITVSGLAPGTTITVYGESRTITSDSGSFDDNFTDYEYHIYHYDTGGGGYTTPAHKMSGATHSWGSGATHTFQ